VFKLTKEYVDRFKSFKTSASIEEFQRSGPLLPLSLPLRVFAASAPFISYTRLLTLCRNLIEVHGLTEFEKGLLINLAPEEVEEAKILIPSLDVSVPVYRAQCL
jgi:hypothetical protein